MRKILPNVGTFYRAVNMSSAFDIAHALERKERQTAGTIENARRRVADKLRIGFGTFENIVRERVKRVDTNIHSRMRALLVRELENEIMRLNHELEMVRQCGEPLMGNQASEIETHLAAARALLREGMTG